MVHISDIQQFPWSMETFPGNFFSICYCFQIFEIFGWKASKVTSFQSLTMVLRFAREARGSSAKTTTANKKKFLLTWKERVAVPRVHETWNYSHLFFFSFLFFSVFIVSFWASEMRPARPSPTLPHQNKGRYTAGTRRFLDSQGFQKTCGTVVRVRR